MTDERNPTISYPEGRRNEVRMTRETWNQVQNDHGEVQVYNRKQLRLNKQRSTKPSTPSPKRSPLIIRKKTNEYGLPVVAYWVGEIPEQIDSDFLEVQPIDAQIPSHIIHEAAQGLKEFLVKSLVKNSIERNRLKHVLERHDDSVLHASTIHGIVSDHLKDSVVIRFNVGGESEERDFVFEDMNVRPDEIPVGTRVIGETRLLRAPAPATIEEMRADMQRINQQVDRELEELGIDPKTVIGTEFNIESHDESAQAGNEGFSAAAEDES